ncbi:hypothetical protein OAL58_00665 [Verrucomicrobia bacterium]|nr:hypothetical protein [Verrucomicrobiota bacterium]
MKNILAEADWWFLDKLDFKGAHLMLEVTEGIVASASQDVSIDDIGTIEGTRPIEVTDRSRRIRIEFSNVLTYQVTDESYAQPASGKIEEVAGRILCEHTGSEYLEYVQQNSLIKHLVDDPLQHYSLNLADDIIDVISTANPSVDLI